MGAVNNIYGIPQQSFGEYGVETCNTIHAALTRGGFSSRYDAATRQIEVLDSANTEAARISALVQNSMYSGWRPVVREERAENGNVQIRLEEGFTLRITRLQLSGTHSLLSIPIAGASLLILIRTEDPAIAAARRQFALLFAEMMKETKQELLSREAYDADDIADMMGSSYDAMIEHSIFKMIAIATLTETTLTFQKGEQAAVAIQFNDAPKKTAPAKIYDALKVAYEKIKSLDSAQTEELKKVLDNKPSNMSDEQVKKARNAITAAKGVINSNVMNTNDQREPVVDWTAIFTG